MNRRGARPGALREFLSGAALLGRGFALWRSAPRIMLTGLIPAAIVGALFVAALIVLALNLGAIAEALTPFAARWDEPYRTAIRIAAGLALLATAALLLVFTFTATTLIVGQPFYERIWRHVEAQFGPVPGAGPRGFWRQLGRAVGDGLRLLLPTVLLGLTLFAIGLVPVIGTVSALLIGALLGGWLLAVELTGLAFDARGSTISERRRILRARRPLALGFGLASYLLFLLPLGAVIAMPAAVAGATLLTRRVTHAETQ